MMKKRQFLVLFILTTIILGCSGSDEVENQETIDFDNTENEQDTSFDSSKYYYFISGKIEGKRFFYGQHIDDKVLNYQEVSSGSSESSICAYSLDQGSDSKISYSTSIYPNFDNEDSQPQMGINFIRFYRCSNSQNSNEVFNDVFSVGDYEYSVDNQNSGEMRQIGINYSPTAKGSEYYESYGVIGSSNSFRITDSQEKNEFLLGRLITQKQLIEGEFSVKLYNTDDTLDFIEITEGRFKITVMK